MLGKVTKLLEVALSNIVEPDMLRKENRNRGLLLQLLPVQFNLFVDDIFGALLSQDGALIVFGEVANLTVVVLVEGFQDHFLYFNFEVVHHQPS